MIAKTTKGIANSANRRTGQVMKRRVACMLIIASLIAAVNVAFAEEKVGYVTSTGLYIRKEASEDAEALRCAANGEKLVILREVGSWYYVKYNSVVSGYVAKKFVSSKKPGASSSDTAKSSGSNSSSSSSDTSATSIKELGAAPATSKLGDRGSDVKKLQQALKLMGYYTSSCDGVFGSGTETAVKKFQRAKGLSQDGVAGKVTIWTIFGEDASNAGSSTSSSSSSSSSGGNVKKLDWYAGGSSAIPRGAYFTLKDVRTGITLKCRHLYGSNHMDAEPVTKDDTAKLLKIYGGSWSWARRPVLLSYNGNVYAASMNGMPHGEEEILDNNFDGQFCIHYQNSKTHGSSKVDPDHQACVNEAAKSSW